ncbi:MAG: D-alanyl-D-alanine carboxypeptidase/D-alanyl-D-alanine-endopeptidase, partial [Lysinibacillus sp.]
MKRVISIIVPLLLVWTILFMPQEANASSILDKSVSNAIGKTNSSVTLRSAKTGNIIYQHSGSIARQTASNMKLLTGAAVLQELGEQYRFETTLYIDGEIKNNILHGDVYLKGSGDPTLQYKNLQTIAKALRKKGIKKVEGNLYLDDTLFTGSTLPPGAVKSEETYYYAARTSALNMSPNEDFDGGTVIVQVTGTKSGAAPTVKILPHSSGQKIVNKARTGKTTSISVRRQYNTNQIIVSGTIAPGRSTKSWVTVHNPTIATGHAFTAALKSAGVS